MSDSHQYDGQDLEALSELPNYHAMILDEFGPALKGRVLEIGAGTGTMAVAYRSRVDSAVLVEPAKNLCAEARQRFEGDSAVKIIEGTLQEALDRQDPSLAPGSFDAVVLVNVLEHVADDVGLLAQIKPLLRPGGHLLLMVPAWQTLYGSLDEAVQHVRRYSPTVLAAAVGKAGYAVAHLRSIDALGVIPWFVMGRVVRRRKFDGGLARLYDRVGVPATRAIENAVNLPGKNVVLVAEAVEEQADAPLLSVVMPCYNEQATLAEIVSRVLKQPFDLELLIVDDGSKDRSVEIAKELAARNSRIRVLEAERNGGKGTALRRGFRAARGHYVLIQDADLEYDPSDYGTLMEPLLTNEADVVYGSRFQHGARRVLYFWHSIGNWALTTASNMATDLNLSDMETGYKVFRRWVVRSLLLEEARFGIEPEMTAKIANLPEVRIYEVPVTYHGRTYQQGKKIGLRDAFRAAYVIARYGLPWR